jgi:hypothetical protein
MIYDFFMAREAVAELEAFLLDENDQENTDDDDLAKIKTRLRRLVYRLDARAYSKRQGRSALR